MQFKLLWEERPEEIKTKILEAWAKLATHTNDLWVYHGKSNPV